jgi:hypothetical protein
VKVPLLPAEKTSFNIRTLTFTTMLTDRTLQQTLHHKLQLPYLHATQEIVKNNNYPKSRKTLPDQPQPPQAQVHRHATYEHYQMATSEQVMQMVAFPYLANLQNESFSNGGVAHEQRQHLQ